MLNLVIEQTDAVAVGRVDGSKIISLLVICRAINAFWLCPQFCSLKVVAQHLLPLFGIEWLLKYLSKIVFCIGHSGKGVIVIVRLWVLLAVDSRWL